MEEERLCWRPSAATGLDSAWRVHLRVSEAAKLHMCMHISTPLVDYAYTCTSTTRVHPLIPLMLTTYLQALPQVYACECRRAST